ncbi:MAG TPA: hypothetical protein DIT07_15230 [Sphingobacteriaceae bacterium]|nr:hypothetical protein [Sphingobacteriaceae bacterium]
MLTFEEFFTKKKIDLVQLQKAEPVLFAEFKKEFEPMGEKSFDHSKKFWFNKLRRLYHLKEEPKPAKTEIEMTEIASQAEPLDSPTIEQKPAYTPGFKPATIKPSQNPPTPGSNPALKEKPKPAYQSRFKMQTTVKQDDQPIASKVEPAETAPENPEAKPAAYKPRFNMKTVFAQTAKTDEKEVPDSDITPSEEKSAAYKPRFNMKNIKPKSEE